MLYEFHMLKNYPPTNLNRDDSGAPKTCLFGGVNRGRISSQCLKRSWRTSELFRQEIGPEALGIRTRHLPRLVCDKLAKQGVDEAWLQELLPKLTALGNKDAQENKKGNYMPQIVFFAAQDIDAVAEAVQSMLKDCHSAKDVKALKAKELTAAVTGANVRPVSLDIALFGRMVTSDAFKNVEAAMQVAHAITTHKTALESDYFTAMDDLLSGDTMEESGSGMIGDIDYSASCYYIYASLDTDKLRDNLEYADDPDLLVRKSIPALLRAMALTNPSGKQNSFAGHVLPSAILVECKNTKIPVSLVNAFTDPVRAGKEGDLVETSIKRLVSEADMMDRSFGIPVEKRLWFCVDKYDVQLSSEHVVCKTFADLTAAVTQTLE